MAPGAITKTLQGGSAALVALGGLLAALAALNDQFRQAVDVLVTLPTWGWGAIALALLLIGVWQLVIWRQKRSELLRPEALRLERDNPEHLVGREDDIAALEQKCRGHGLVFLEGESGSGKSALMRAGLLPLLRTDGRLVPLVVSVWGTDWERGPQRELADELWVRLDMGQREKLKLASPPEPEALSQALSAMRGAIGATPLLVFDQFDDYQARHRGQFLPGKTKSWLSAPRLKETNAFWRAVAELCEQESVHVLIVTRSDTAAGLESVRFQEPETHRLDRLQTAYVAPLLARLAGTGEAAAIRAPERGWDRLRQRLAADLERDGFVLPQQLRTALAGLRSLRYLTVADYEKAGGLAGLEAALVAREVKSAARTSGLTEATVRRLLLAMVDDTADWKTVAQPTDKLVAAAADPRADEAAVRSTLDQLSSDRVELVRKRVDPDTRSEAWLLDHDYLTRSIVAAERNANRWRAVLEEGARALEQAGTFGSRWRALLKPSNQLGLLWARLHGRLAYGPYRGYAGKSVLRLAPYALVAVLLAGGGMASAEWQARERADDEANAILQHLLLADDSLAPNEMDALWRLASTDDERVRDSFTEQLLHSTTFAERFNRKPEPVVRALVGLNATRAQRFAQEEIASGSEGVFSLQFAALNLRMLAAPKSIDIGLAVPVLTSGLGRGLEAQALLRLVDTADRTQAQAALDPVLAAMQGTTDPYALGALAQAYQALAGKLSDVQAQAALDPVLAAMQGTTDPDALGALAQAYQALAGKLSDVQAQAALDPVLAAMQGTTHPYALGALAQALQALAGKLSDVQAQAALDPVLAAMQGTTHPDALGALAQALQALAGKLSDVQAQAALDPVLAAMQGTTHPYALGALAQALQALASKLSDVQAQAALDPVLAAMQGTTHPYALPALAQAYQALAGKLSDVQAQAALDPVLAAMQGTTHPDALGALAQALQALAGKLSDVQAQAALDPVLAAMQGTTDPDALGALAQAYQALPTDLSDVQAQAALDPVLAAMQGTTDPDALRALAQALQALPTDLSDVQAQAALDPVLAAMQGTTHPDALGALAQAYQALAGKLSDVQAQAALDPVLAAMQGTTHPDALGALAQALQALPTDLSDVQAQAALDPVLAAMQGTTHPYALGALAQALQALASKLSDVQAQAALDPVLAAMQGTTDPDALGALAQALQALASKLSDVQAQAALAGVEASLARSGTEDTTKSFLEAVDALTANDDSDQFADLVFALLKCPTVTGEAEAHLLERLRERSGGTAEEAVDLWSAVAWAEGRGGIDLNGPLVPPPYPGP